MRKITYFIFLVTIAIVVFSCHTDDNIISEQTQEVTLSLGYIRYDQQQKSNRSMSLDEEEMVDNIDILSFKPDAGGIYRYSYRTLGTGFTPALFDGKFRARLGLGVQKLVVIVNARQEVDDALQSVTEGEDINTVLPKILAVCIDEWPAHNTGVADPVRYIPMYALLPVDILQGTTSVGSVNTYLVRMLSRIDVGFEKDESGNNLITNFELTEAYLFNRKTQGFVAYSDANWNNVSNTVTSAEVPATANTIKLPTVKYEATANEIRKSIYTFESSGVTAAKDATAIIIGGYFDFPANTTHKTYYRVDIPPTQSNYYSGDMMRNHLYNIAIKKVDKAGALTPERAFDGEFRIEAIVEDWTNADIDTEIDPQYNLSVSPGKVTVSDALAGIQIVARTNHPEGISVVSNTTGGTLTGGADGDLIRVLQLTVLHSGQIILKAGNLEYTVKVE